MSNKIKNTIDSKPKALLKTGFKRSLGLLILFATVTLSSCVELIPIFDIFK